MYTNLDTAIAGTGFSDTGHARSLSKPEAHARSLEAGSARLIEAGHARSLAGHAFSLQTEGHARSLD